MAVVLIMCGSSIATTNLVAGKLEDEAKRRKVRIDTVKGKIEEMDALIAQHNPDLVVATSLPKEHDEAKVFSGVPLISTIGQEKRFDEIFNYIRTQQLGSA